MDWRTLIGKPNLGHREIWAGEQIATLGCNNGADLIIYAKDVEKGGILARNYHIFVKFPSIDIVREHIRKGRLKEEAFQKEDGLVLLGNITGDNGCDSKDDQKLRESAFIKLDKKLSTIDVVFNVPALNRVFAEDLQRANIKGLSMDTGQLGIA